MLTWSLGIEFPENCETLTTTTSTYYDYATLRRAKFFYYKGRDGPYLVCPNGRTLSLPPRPRTLFDIHENDDVRTLTMKVIQYLHHHAIELFGGNVVVVEEGEDDEEAEGDEQEPKPQ